MQVGVVSSIEASVELLMLRAEIGLLYLELTQLWAPQQVEWKPYYNDFRKAGGTKWKERVDPLFKN